MEPTRKPRHESYRQIDRFSLFDLELVRLILRGGSVLDWHRLNLTKPEINSFMRTHRLDLNDPVDNALVERIRNEAVVYLRETLSFPVPRPIRTALAGHSQAFEYRALTATIIRTPSMAQIVIPTTPDCLF